MSKAGMSADSFKGWSGAAKKSWWQKLWGKG